MGFDSTGQALVPTSHAALSEAASKREKVSWEEICSKAAKIISFIDLAGHEKYFKTTVFGLTGTSPHFALLVVGANAGLIGSTWLCELLFSVLTFTVSKEHLAVVLALAVPVSSPLRNLSR